MSWRLSEEYYEMSEEIKNKKEDNIQEENIEEAKETNEAVEEEQVEEEQVSVSEDFENKIETAM